MNKSTLIDLLRKFSHKELKEFGEYVSSPFFNKNHSVIKLYDYLRKQYPDFNVRKLKKEYVYGKIFPKAVYNDGFMRTIMFNLANLAEDFLTFKRVKLYYFTEKKFLLYELNERELDRLFEKNMKIISKKLTDEQIKDADYYYNMYNIEYENLYYLGRTNLDKIESIVKKSDVEDMFNHLTYFYLIHAMTHYTYFLNIMELYRFSFKTDVFEDILKILRADSYLEVPAVSLSYNVLMLFLSEDDDSHFYKTKELLEKHKDEFNRDQINNAYLNLKNYCKRMILKGRENFLKELFKIYKIDIGNKTYMTLNDMSFRYYTDVVETALKLKEYSWVKEFIEKYRSSLTADSRENTYLYALALYEFAVKNFEKSLELLSTVKYNDVYHKLKYRSLMLMLCYELDYVELLLSHLDSFNHFLLNDNLISNERKIYYSGFIKYIRNLSGLRDKVKKQDLQSLKQKVTEDRALYNKEWVIEKIDELID